VTAGGEVDELKVWMDVGESRLNLGNNGIVLHVAGGAGKVGRLRIGRAVAEYFPGKTSVNSKTVTLEDLLKFIKETGK
jgi:hypothetical protein